MTMGTEGAAVIPFERGGVPAVREEYEQAIQLWCKTRDTAESLSREEIGAMRAFDRIDAQRKAIIIHLAHYYREHDRADVAPGLAVILTLLSDNDKGCAQISQEVLAQFFGRSRTAIYQAQSRLKESGIIVTGRGRHAKTYPVIPRAVTKGYNHLQWTVSAIAQDSVNCQVPASNSQLLRQPEQLTQLPSPLEELPDFNCQVEPVSIAKADLTPIHYKTSLSTPIGAGARIAAAGIAAAIGSMPAAAGGLPPEQHVVQQVPAPCWQNPRAQQAAALDIHELRAQKQIWITDTGAVQVSGAFRDELAEAFPLVELQNGLAAACANVKTDRGALEAIKQVRRQFGYMQQDAAQRERRAASRQTPKETQTASELSAKYDRLYDGVL